MGLSLEEFQSAAGSIGSILDKTTTAWQTIAGKTTVATPTTQPASPSAPATPNQAVNQGSASGVGLASVPPWLWLGGAIVLVLASRKRG